MKRIKRFQIKSLSDLKKIESLWKKLEKGEEMTAFQYFDWNCLLFEKWKSWYINRLFSKCYVYLYFEGTEVKLIAPVIVKNKTMKNDVLAFHKGIYFLGDNTHSDYLNFIYYSFNRDIVQNMINYIKNDFHGFPFYLNKVRSDNSINSMLHRDDLSPHSSIQSVSVRIFSSEDEYLSLLSKSTRQNLRTSRNRMEKADLEYQVEVINNTLPLQTIENLIKIHEKRVIAIRENEYNALKSTKYKSRLIKVYKHINALEKRYDLVSNSMANLSNSVFIIVKLSGKIVSYLYGLKDKNSIRVIHNCFDEDYAFYSPMFRGAYDFILDECKNHTQGISYLDFTLGNENYKFKLGGKETIINNFVM